MSGGEKEVGEQLGELHETLGRSKVLGEVHLSDDAGKMRRTPVHLNYLPWLSAALDILDIVFLPTPMLVAKLAVCKPDMLNVDVVLIGVF
jgi:hypothetical protein